MEMVPFTGARDPSPTQQKPDNITIEGEENDSTLARCIPQTQSPLFSMLPREIRDLIWQYATAPVEDIARRYPENAYYCRPGHRAPWKTYTNVMYVCRRVWLEANAFAMLQAEHCFWYHRAAPDARRPEWTAGLTDLNRQNFGDLHLFAQMFAIEGLRQNKGDLRGYFLKTPERAGDFQPKTLHVTIRHTDWWWWESDTPLRLKESWVQALLDSPDLRSTQALKLELETLDYKLDQLAPILDNLKARSGKESTTHFVDGKPTKTSFQLVNEPEVHKWTGPAEIDGRRLQPYQGKSSLNYHVVTLTWCLVFPEIPRAHVPTLRLAPRIGARKPPMADSPPSHAQTPSEPHQSRRSRMRQRKKLARNDAHERRSNVHTHPSATVARRFEEEAKDRRARQDAVEAEKRRWEARWEAEGSLLRFQ